MKIIRAIAGALVLVASTSALSAQTILVSSRDAISGSTLSWSTLFGPAPYTINNDPKQTPVSGLTVMVNAAAPAQLLTQQWGSWPGNFSPGDDVLFSATGPIEFLFSDDIFAFGTNVQSSNLSAFTGTITAYDMFDNEIGTFNRLGLSNTLSDGSAIFLGIGSDIGFRRIVMNTSGTGIAVNHATFGNVVENFGHNPPSINEEELPTITTPEPTSVALLGAGMLVLGAAYRRRQRS